MGRPRCQIPLDVGGRVPALPRRTKIFISAALCASAVKYAAKKNANGPQRLGIRVIRAIQRTLLPGTVELN